MKFENVKSVGMQFDYKVLFEANDIEEKIIAEVTEKAKKFKMQGFRTGKVPFQIVRNHVEASVMNDVFENLVSFACDELVKNSQYQTLASKPVYNFATPYVKGEDLSLDVTLEFAPEFELKAIDLELKKIVPNVSQKDIEEKRNFVMHNNPYRENADEEYAIQVGDEVSYKAVCFDNGKKIEARSFKNKFVVPHDVPEDAEFILGFIGKKINEQFDFSPATEKHLTYKMIVKSINRAIFSISPDEFAVKAGFKDLAHFDLELKKNLEESINNSAFLYHKNQILENLVENYSFDLPAGIVNLELRNVIDGVKKDLEKSKASGEASEEDLAKTDDDLNTEYADVVNKRVLLGYVLSKIAKQYGIAASDQEVHAAIMSEINSAHPSLSQQIIDYYSNNSAAITYKKAEIVEAKVIVFLISRAKVIEVLKTKEEVEVLIKELLAE